MKIKKLSALLLIYFLTLPVIHELNGQDSYSKVIVTAENTQEAENKTNYIFLDHETKKILIVAGEYDLKQEQDSFAQWRKRYLPWWGFWYFMKLIDKLWIS